MWSVTEKLALAASLALPVCYFFVSRSSRKHNSLLFSQPKEKNPSPVLKHHTTTVLAPGGLEVELDEYLTPLPVDTKRQVGRWTREEDALLSKAVELENRESRINWKEISIRYFRGTRNSAQCKSRWSKVRPVSAFNGTRSHTYLTQPPSTCCAVTLSCHQTRTVYC
jgi:hypothetical protein